MVVIQEGNIVKKTFFFLKITVFDPRKGSSHPLLVRDVLIYVFQKSTSNNPSLHVQCIWQIFLFQEYCYLRVALTATDFEWTVSSSGGHFQFLFRILCFFETSTCSHPFFQRNWLICHTSYSHPLLERLLFYCKIPVAAMHSFKFTVLFQNRSSSKEVS